MRWTPIARALALSLSVAAVCEVTSAQPAPRSAPSLQFHEASGCGGLLLYTWNHERTEVLLVRIDQSRVKLPDGATEFELHSSAGVTVQLEVTDAPRDEFPYCSDDERPSGPAPTTWTAVSGKIKVMLRRRPKAAFSPVSVEVDRLVLQGPAGNDVKQHRELRFTAAIGDAIK